MKRSLKAIVITIFTIYSNILMSQGDCSLALPFCANQGTTTFSASTNTTAQIGPDYGCLLSQPNPAWYYFQVSQTGSISISIAGTGGGDVDFICWGPFTSAFGNCGNLTSGNTVDCSFSGSPTETCVIGSAVAGEFYMLLLTNFSNQPQNIDFSQPTTGPPGSGIGATNCSLLNGVVSSQTVCPGATATLVANSSLDSVSYVWNTGATTSSITVSPSATTIYTVTISGIDPATSTATTVPITGTVTLYTPPTPTLSSNSLVCPGSVINLSATSGMMSYTWTGPPSLNQITTVNSLSIPNAAANMVGNYTVIVKSVQGCTATATSSVGLVPTSTINVVPGYTVCQGGVVTLTASATGATGYSWIGPGNFIVFYQNPTLSAISVNQGGTYTVSANFTSGTSTCTTKNTSTINVIPALPASLSPILPVCHDGTINLSSPIGDQYSWSGPASFASTVQNPSVSNATPFNGGIYTVTITISGCASTGSVNIVVYNPLSFMSLPRDTTLCFGKVGFLSTNGGLGGSGSYYYGWSPVTSLSSPNAQTTLVSGQSTTTYTLTLSDANCPVTPTQTTAVTVSVNPTPVITFSTSNARGCEPFCTDLISSSNPPSVNCSWKFSTNLSTNSCNTSSFCFPIHGSYDASLTVTDVNGCVDSISQSAFIMVDPKPVPSFEWSPTNPTVLINQVNYTDLSTVGLPMQSWFWNFGDDYASMNSDTSSQQHPFHVYDNAGTYMVSLQVVNAYGCQQTVTKLVNVEEEFALFIPNAFSPGKQDGVNDNFNVKGIGFLPDEFEMAIYDRWGTQVFKTNDLNKGWDGQMKNGSKITSDVYIYKIRVKDYHKRIKSFVGHVTVL